MSDMNTGASPADEMVEIDRFVKSARQARLTFCVFPKDVRSPLFDDAGVSRLLYAWLPELARREGAELAPRDIPSEELGGLVPASLSPQQLARAIDDDMQRARRLSDWLGPHVSGDVAALMSRGDDSILQPVLDRFAARHGFVAPVIAHSADRPDRSGSELESVPAPARPLPAERLLAHSLFEQAHDTLSRG